MLIIQTELPSSNLFSFVTEQDQQNKLQISFRGIYLLNKTDLNNEGRLKEMQKGKHDI